MDKVTENDVKRYLNEWFRKRGREASETEVQLPPMKYGDKTTKPDVLAFRKRANTVYLIECKRATRLRYIGHGFGQILATKLAFRKMRKTELKKKLMRETGKERIGDLKFEFGVAFPKQHVNASKSIQRMITMFQNLPQFKDFTVYVASKDKVQRKHRGRAIRYDKL